jgi:hypothetical protein
MIILEKKYSCMQIGEIRKVWDEDKKIDDNYYFEEENIDICLDLKQIDEKTQQLIFNKTLILLKNTSRSMMQIIDDSE